MDRHSICIRTSIPARAGVSESNSSLDGEQAAEGEKETTVLEQQ